MRFKLLFAFILVFASATARAEAGKPAAINWHDSTRDVYINAELDPAAQVLSSDSPSRLALISSKLDRAVVLNVDERTASTVSKEAFHFSDDRTAATSDSNAQAQSIGSFTRIDGPVYVFVVDGKPVIIRAHPGMTGEMTMEKLWETVPVWRAVMESYKPQASAVEAIKASDKEATVTLVYGTWCPDSKNYIPRLIKALKLAGNDKLHVKLIGVDNQFREPVATVQPRGIINVPTVIIERDGRELGRIIETPASQTMEEDLAAILSGKPVVHNGRWDRGARLASGQYSYRDSSGKERGSEKWELFATAEGGYLLHSRIASGDMMTEVFHRVDARHRPTFVEVTKQRGSDWRRTRHTIDAHTLTIRCRGTSSGVITQTIEVPDRLILVSPAVAAQGWKVEPVPAGQDANQMTSYIAPVELDEAAGALAQAIFQMKDEQSIKLPTGEIRAKHFARKIGNETSEWWLDPQLGIPVRGQTSSGLQFVLTSLETQTTR